LQDAIETIPYLTWCEGAVKDTENPIERTRDTPRCEDLDRATKGSKTLAELGIKGGVELWLATPLLVDFTEFLLPDMSIYIPYSRSIEELRKRILLALEENADKEEYQPAMRAMRFSIGLDKDDVYKKDV